MAEYRTPHIGWQRNTKQLPMGADETTGTPEAIRRERGYNFWSGMFIPALLGIMLATVIGVTFVRMVLVPYHAQSPVQSTAYIGSQRTMPDNGRGQVGWNGSNGMMSPSGAR